MMIKYRVSEVAKDFGVQSKEIIALLAKFSETPKKSATALQEDELDIIFDYLTQQHNQENLDEYFAEADRLRDELKAQGVEVIDIPNGAKWKRV